ncbi:hypothetical protein ABL78_4761 [Leptomonas seymouri]|uniref:Uncharacterized protein n=1 Tax=Leptomonas seymouri TaxID=5684 RepID=A0A0N1I5X2_LEPSE|nr:hypothetical protein ABL78_4761 [Leptomonas seymouri]|eukprot:KPI86172.1 hypothetical protein ABL78_4761 [Leptomonas seymouri]
MPAPVAGASAAAGSTVAPSPQPATPQFSPRAHKLATLSASELRAGMQQHFRANGTLQQLKTQLRGMMLIDLLQKPKTARMLVSGAAQSTPPHTSSSSPLGQDNLEDMAAGLQRSSAPGAADAGPSGGRAIVAVPRHSDHTLQTWSCGLADALVENHLRRTRRAMSLSIFSAEAEVPPFTTGGAPSEEEQYLAHLFRQSATDGSLAAPSSPAAEDDFLNPSPSRSVKSVLQRLVEDSITKQGSLSGPDGAARHLHTCSTQTDAADSTDGATNPLNSLECRLAAVDAQYALTFAQLRRTGATGEQPFFLRSEVERRLAQHKNDMHAQLRSEYEQKYNAFTRVQLQEARDEAEQRYRVLVRNKTEEFAQMERSVLVKMEQERERLKLSWEDVHQQRMEMERRQRDMMRQLADQEAAQQHKDSELQEVKERCRMLQLQCAKWEELCAARLMELDGARSREERRVEDIRRLQAEHASELRLKDEEVSRLRYRIRLLSREVEVPTATPATGEEASTGNATSASKEKAEYRASNVAAPVDPKQLYGLLLRTEELQRNAVLQQQRQQQRWDAAWVASAASVAMEPPLGTGADGAKVSALAAGQSLSLTSPQSAMWPADQAPQAGAAVVLTPGSDDGGVPRQPATTASTAVEKPPSISVVSNAVLGDAPAPTPGAASAGDENPTLALSSSLAAPAPIVAAPQPAGSRQAGLSKAGTTSTTPATASERTSPSRESASSPSSASKSASSSFSANPQKIPDKGKGEIKSSGIDTAVLRETESAEGVSRSGLTTEEGTARAEIVWLEKNKREIVEEMLRQSNNGHDDSSDDGDGGNARPWERLGMGGAAQTAPAVGSGTIFDNSFSSDDDALIHPSSQESSDF